MPVSRARRTDGREPFIALLAVSIAILAGIGTATYVLSTSPPPGGVGSVQTVLCAGGVEIGRAIYDGAHTGYLSADYGEFPTWCRASSLPPGSLQTAPLYLHSSDAAQAHSIQRVSLLAPYRLIAETPTMPTAISAGGNLTISLTIQVPSLPGEYDYPAVVIVAA
ncbi:MAG: hypothetical protein L3J91_03475 [Thermoplasmata archaeon]|nr:hypothetical protein [Thermoplasmata archaeon]